MPHYTLSQHEAFSFHVRLAQNPLKVQVTELEELKSDLVVTALQAPCV